MKKLIFTASAFLMTMVGSIAMAQESGVLLENDFWKKNWYISGGVGTSIFVGDEDGASAIGSRFAPAFELSAGTWFTPYVGVRAQISGFQLNGHTANGSSSTVFGAANSDGIYNEKWGYMYLHADAMLNLLNLIQGYEEERFYTLTPFAGTGLAHSFKNGEDALGLSVGVVNSFRLSSAFDANVEVRGTAFSEDGFDNKVGGVGFEGIATITVGVTYRIGAQGWERGYGEDVVNGYKSDIKKNEAAIAKYKSDLAAADKKNSALQSELDKAKKGAEAAKKGGNGTTIPSVVIAFDFGSSKLSKLSKFNLENIAKAIKSSDSSKKFTVTGYADKQTGSASVNEKLSKARALAAYNYLIDKCGVSASKLTSAYEGGVDFLAFDDPTMSRVVIIK